MDTQGLPNIDTESLNPIDETQLFNPERSEHKPRILLLYGSLRKRSFSRLAVE